MELGKFREEPIAPILEKHYVEARLHTDGKDHIDRIKELQEQYVGGIGLPNYIIVDPDTLKKHGRYEGIAITESDVDDFVDFLNDGLKAIRGT